MAREVDPHQSPLALVARRWFGGPTELRSRLVSVATTVTELLPNNPNRIAWVIENRSVNNGAIGFDNETTFANGLKIGADGGFASMVAETDGESVGYRLVGINEAAAGDWRVVETIILKVEGAGVLVP